MLLSYGIENDPPVIVILKFLGLILFILIILILDDRSHREIKKDIDDETVSDSVDLK